MVRAAALGVIAVHAWTGYVLTVGVDGLLWGDSRWAAVRGVVLFLVLAAGAFALHGATTRPDGAAGPRYGLEIGVVMMVGSLLLSITLTPAYRLAFAACFLLGVLYSMPPVRLEARAGLDAASVALAFGLLTPYAGGAVTGKALDAVSRLVLLGFIPLAAAGYSLAALWRVRDRPSGVRTLAVRLGERRTLWVAVCACAAAFAVWLLAWVLRGDLWHVPGGSLLGLLSLAIALAAWTGALRSCARDREQMTTAEERRMLYQAALAWVASDAAVVMAFGL